MRSSVLMLFLVAGVAVAEPQCSYSTYKWNVDRREAVDFKRVAKPYSSLKPHEKDAVTGCTVCEQDQRTISLPGIEPFNVCHAIAGPLRETLLTLVERGAPIRKVVGYRVGMTRGATDDQGNRTRFSNHAFGVAVDINPQANGLYDNCLEYGDACRLIKGGPWRPESNPYSLERDGAIVKSLKAIGLRWGGEIAGRQKDFMHFSITGY